MLPYQLKKSTATAVIEENGNFYSFDSLYRNIEAYRQMIQLLKLYENDYFIGIHFESNFQNVTAVLACITESVNFTILNSKDTKRDFLIKLKNAKVNVILSDIITDVNILTLNQNFIIIKEGVEVNHFNSEERKRFNVTVAKLQNITTQVGNNLDLSSELNRARPLLQKDRHCIVFHSGITDLFKASVFQLEALEKGLLKGLNELPYSKQGKFLFMEPFDLMYDVISGVLVPLLMGRTVVFGNSNFLKYNGSDGPVSIYMNSSRLSRTLRDYSYEVPKILKTLNIGIINNLIVKKTFSNIFGKKVKELIVVGKLSNSMKVLNLPIINLYSIAEVASFVSFNKIKNFTKKLEHVGKIDTSKVSILGEHLGEIFIYTEDSCVSFLDNVHASDAFLHGFPGKIRTYDAGYIKDNKLYVVGKSKFTFTEHNQIIDEARLTDLALSFDFVGDAKLSLYNGKLLLIVDVNIPNATREGLTYETLVYRCTQLKHFINRNVNEYSRIHNVLLYTVPGGFLKTNYKLVSRHF